MYSNQCIHYPVYNIWSTVPDEDGIGVFNTGSGLQFLVYETVYCTVSVGEYMVYSPRCIQYSIWYSIWCDVYLFFRPALQICMHSQSCHLHSCSTDVHFEESNLDIKCCLLLLTGEI